MGRSKDTAPFCGNVTVLQIAMVRGVGDDGQENFFVVSVVGSFVDKAQVKIPY